MPVIRSQESAGETSVMLIEVDTVPAAADPVYGDTRETRAEKLLQTADGLFREGLELARDCAAEVHSTIVAAAQDARPDEVEVTLAIKLDAEVGAFVAKSSAGAQLEVKLTWRLDA